MKNRTSVFAVAALIFACAGVSRSSTVPPSEITPYIHPQRLVDVGGHRINVYCTGHGSPTVILDAGQTETTFAWHKVQPKIARFTRVCSYDRAGFGFSSGGPLPRDASATVRDLHTALERAHIAPPYILVGHSIAGLYALLYADRYGPQVAGMVLVDPSFPNETKALEAVSPSLKHMDALAPSADAFCYSAARRGMLGFAHASQETALCGFPPTVATDLHNDCIKNGPAYCKLEGLGFATYARASFWAAYQSEDLSSNGLDDAEDVEEQRNYGAMPLTILTAANDVGGSPLPPKEMQSIDRVWNAGHDRLAHLSTVGSNFVIEHTGHDIQLDRPGVVSAAVAEVVSQAKRSVARN